MTSHDDASTAVLTVGDYLRVGLAAMRAEKALLRAIILGDKESEKTLRGRYIRLQVAVEKFRLTNEYAKTFGCERSDGDLQ